MKHDHAYTTLSTGLAHACRITACIPFSCCYDFKEHTFIILQSQVVSSIWVLSRDHQDVCQAALLSEGCRGICFLAHLGCWQNSDLMDWLWTLVSLLTVNRGPFPASGGCCILDLWPSFPILNASNGELSPFHTICLTNTPASFFLIKIPNGCILLV